MNKTPKSTWMQSLTKLQRDSVIQLMVCTLSALLSIACFSVMAKSNTKGLEYILIILVTGGIGSLASIIYMKKYYRTLDERQVFLSLKASRFSAFFFVFYILALSITAFFIVGGKVIIEVYYIPVTVFIGLFLSQLVETIILFFAEPVE